MNEKEIIEILNDNNNYKIISVPTGQIINGSKVVETFKELDFGSVAKAIMRKIKE